MGATAMGSNLLGQYATNCTLSSACNAAGRPSVHHLSLPGEDNTRHEVPPQIQARFKELIIVSNVRLV
jgi:hypothetical protein